MNKIIVTSLFSICLSSAYGQTSFGIKAGINRNDILIENAPFLPIALYQPSIGFHAGIFAKKNLSDKFSFNPEFLFVQRGANTSSETRINLNYLEFPFLLSYNPIKLLSFEAGPNASVKLSAKEISDNEKKDVSDQFDESFDFGINAGMKFNLSSKISMIGRYYHGLRSVRNFPEVKPDTSPSSAIKTFQFSIHYLLKGKT